MSLSGRQATPHDFPPTSQDPDWAQGLGAGAFLKAASRRGTGGRTPPALLHVLKVKPGSLFRHRTQGRGKGQRSGRLWNVVGSEAREGTMRTGPGQGQASGLSAWGLFY